MAVLRAEATTSQQLAAPGERGGRTRPGNDYALAATVLVSSATTTIA